MDVDHPKHVFKLKTVCLYLKKTKKRFLVKLMQHLACHRNFLFHESLGEIFSSPRKDYQVAYRLKTNRIENKNNGTER